MVIEAIDKERETKWALKKVNKEKVNSTEEKRKVRSKFLENTFS